MQAACSKSTKTEIKMINPEDLQKDADANALQALETTQKIQQRLDMVEMRLSILESINEARDVFDSFLRNEFSKLNVLGGSLETLLFLAATWKTLDKFPGGQIGAFVAATFIVVLLEEALIDIIF